MRKIIFFSSIFWFSIFLISCEKEEKPIENVIRSVKTLVISESSKANTRSISGVVKASDKSELSFRVGGRVKSVKVKRGSKVNPGQVLATLDSKDYRLEINSKQAKLESARADLAEKKDHLKRQKNLKAKDFVSQAAVEKAEASYKSALSNVKVAQADLENAQDNMSRTVLRSPFSGKIAEKNIDPFIEIVAGTTVFVLQSDDGFKIELLMPETLIRDVDYGDLVTVRFPTLKNVKVGGTVKEIGARTETGNAFPIKVELAETKADLRAGMSADVTFNYGEKINTSVYLIPISSIDMRLTDKKDTRVKDQAPVFIFDPETSTLLKRKVRIRDVRGNRFEVIEGLKDGDIIVTAGVAFLSEGQRVKQWSPTYNLPATLKP
jgi:multidrug efflux system membrane fusion protein